MNYDKKQLIEEANKFSIIRELFLSCSEAFYKVFNDYINTTKRESLSKELNLGKYGGATLFELSVYCLFRLDLSLVENRQKYNSRKELFFFLRKTIEDFENKLQNDNLDYIIDHRINGYAKMFHDISEENVIKQLHSPLLQLVMKSENRDKVDFWDFEKGPIEPNVLKTSLLRGALLKGEKIIMTPFQCSISNLFQNNDDFKSLTLEEIGERINAGLRESKKYFKND